MCLLAAAAVHSVPPNISMKAARDEAEMVMFTSVKAVLEACNLKPRQVRSSCDEAVVEGILLHTMYTDFRG
jgi:hypothetical protein